MNPVYNLNQHMPAIKKILRTELIVPKLVTGWVQTLYYGITIRAGDPKPRPGTPHYIKHRRRIHITVVVLYLLYTLYEADHWVQQKSDFYHDLGLTPGVGEKQIKSRFRRLCGFTHPLMESGLQYG